MNCIFMTAKVETFEPQHHSFLNRNFAVFLRRQVRIKTRMAINENAKGQMIVVFECRIDKIN